jgi:ribosomal protein S27E
MKIIGLFIIFIFIQEVYRKLLLNKETKKWNRINSNLQVLCPKCGNEMPQNKEICDNCGKNLKETQGFYIGEICNVELTTNELIEYEKNSLGRKNGVVNKYEYKDMKKIYFIPPKISINSRYHGTLGFYYDFYNEFTESWSEDLKKIFLEPTQYDEFKYQIESLYSFDL